MRGCDINSDLSGKFPSFLFSPIGTVPFNKPSTFRKMESTAGFANLSYGHNTRSLNEAINKLRECGSEAILGEMPKIAIIGNQSAGKSSLIEAMSGVSPFSDRLVIADTSPSKSGNLYPMSSRGRHVPEQRTRRQLVLPNFSAIHV